MPGTARCRAFLRLQALSLNANIAGIPSEGERHPASVRGVLDERGGDADGLISQKHSV